MPGIHFREVVCMLGILGYFLQVAAGHILYLALHLESGSFPRPLPPERERAAFADLRQGGAAAAAARDTLIRHNLRLVAHICKKYYAGDAAQDDYISIGTIGLIKAVDTFDPDKGKKFASYASRCIENELRMELRRTRRAGTQLSLQEPLEAQHGGAAARTGAADHAAAVRLRRCGTDPAADGADAAHQPQLCFPAGKTGAEAAARSLERIKMMLNWAGVIYLREAHVWQGVANCAAHVPHLDEASNLCGK